MTVRPGALLLVTSVHGTRYAWRCAGCGAHVSKHAEGAAVGPLVTSGVKRVTVQPEVGVGPPITEDDLIEFGRQLEATP